MIIALSGPVHSGKTALLERAAVAMKKKGAAVGGYLTPSERAPDNRIEGYALLSLRDGRRFPFLSRDARGAAARTGPFFMLGEGLRRAEELIRKAPDDGLLVVDEVGPLELGGGGVRSALEEALAVRKGPTLLVIRESLLEEALESLGISGGRVIDVRAPGAEEALLKWPAESCAKMRGR